MLTNGRTIVDAKALSHEIAVKVNDYFRRLFSHEPVHTTQMHQTKLVTVAICGMFVGLIISGPLGHSITNAFADDHSVEVIGDEISENKTVIVIKQDVSLEDATITALRTKHFNEEQTRLLRAAYDLGAEIGYPETMQAIILQETAAGGYSSRVGDKNLPIGKRSYGVGQVKVSTTRFVFNNFPAIKDQYFGDRKLRNITDEEIIVLLLTDDDANLLITTKNFELMVQKTHSWAEAVVGYNQGLGGLRKVDNPSTFEYTQKIRAQIVKHVRPFNKEMGLGVVASN